MPWNEPGGDGKDPWSKGQSGDKSNGSSSGNSQGNPVDNIEDIKRKVNDKFGGLFGKKKLGSSNGPSGSSLIIIGLIAVAAWLATGFYTVGSGESGVEFRFGAFTKATPPGLNWRFPYPIGSVELVDIDRVRTAEDRTHMLTSDENIVDLGVAAQYKIKNAEDYLFSLYLPDYEPNQSNGTLFQVMRSAVREIASRNTMDSILKENRGEIAPATRKVMQSILDEYKSGLEVIKVNVTYAEAPKQVKDAFDDANRAREDLDKFKNQAETYANSVVPIAEGKASRLREAATAYESQVISKAEGDASRFTQLVAEYKKAPEVTRNRLYLDTMESVYENTSKVIVDSKSGNNLLYLPLNQLNMNKPAKSTAGGFDPAAAGLVEQGLKNQRAQQKSNRTIRDGVRDATRGTRR